MTRPEPYLSVVVAARNDDHGGNLLGRMQAFINGLLGQANRHALACELIVVEWNPPPDRPPLAEILRWPRDTAPCAVRFVTVPESIHARYRYAAVLPLYQMIAKNVGIRRARGRFVLATNIDIIFSDELIRYIAAQHLTTGRMYRIDRHDVMADIPVNGSLDEQLSYCQTHLIRINTKEGTYKLTPDGLPALETEDVAAPGIEVNFGPGWFPVEGHTLGEVFRWAENDAAITIRVPREPSPLVLDLEPGPGVGGGPFVLQILDESGAAVADAVIHSRSRVELHIPCGENPVRRLRLHACRGGLSIPRDPRILNFRIFHLEWGRAADIPADGKYRLHATRKQWRGAPINRRNVQRAYSFCTRAGGLSRAIFTGLRYYYRARRLPAPVPGRDDIADHRMGIRLGRGWYPREQVLGETFRWVRRDAEIILQVRNDLPGLLTLDVEPGPGVGYKRFELLLLNAQREIVGRTHVRGLQHVEFSVPVRTGEDQILYLSLDGGDRAIPEDPRILNFRVFSCRWSQPGAETPVDSTFGEDALLDESSPPVFLHTNGCGDFTLMAREHWLDLRGYPEFDIFSMNLDSVLCYSAHHAGFREEVLRDPLRIYHIEHGKGSGWTPEGQASLYRRLEAQGITSLDYQELVGWGAQMRRLNCPMIFNLENWGLADHELEEVVLGSETGSASAAADSIL